MSCNALYHAGTDDGGHRPILALGPHMNAVRELKGSSRTADDSYDGLWSLMRWEACWSCMPGLESLDWDCFSASLIDYEDRAAGFGLPPGLRDFELSIAWDTAYFSMSTLSTLKHHTKLTTLCFERSESEAEGVEHSLDLSLPEVLQESPDFPLLTTFWCSCTSLTGSLHAPNLVSLHLTHQSMDVLDWATFAGCQLLQNMKVLTFGVMNCCGCSFPKSLERIVLRVEALEEDGCFRELAAPGTNLSSINASIGMSPRNAFDFTALTNGTTPTSLRVQQGRIELCVPAITPSDWWSQQPSITSS